MLAIILMLPGVVLAQKIDPILNATVMSQTSTIGGKLDDTNSHLKSISATNAVMTVTLDSIRSYQEIMLSGL